MKILLIGATGALGRRTASELIRSPDVDALTLTGRRGPEAERLAAHFRGRREAVQSAELDLRERGAVVELARRHDVVVSAAGPGYEVEILGAEAALESGNPYVSLSDDEIAFEQVVQLAERARAVGTTIVSGCGFSPGVTDLLVALAARELESISAIDISVAPSSRDTDGDATQMHFLHMLASRGLFISEGARARARAGTMPKPVYFPEPVGWVETFRCGHPEVLAWWRKYPNLDSLSFRLGLTERAVMDSARALAATRVIAGEKGRRFSLKMTKPFLPLLERLPPPAPSWSAVRVDVHGTGADGKRTISLGLVDHLANVGAVTLAEMALALGASRGQFPGVRTADEIVDPAGFLARLAARGIRIARLEPHPV